MQNKYLTDEITVSSIIDKSMTSINIPYGINTIGNYAFSDFNNLSNVIIPDSINLIRSDAFMNCTSLTNNDSKWRILVYLLPVVHFVLDFIIQLKLYIEKAIEEKKKS